MLQQISSQVLPRLVKPLIGLAGGGCFFFLIILFLILLDPKSATAQEGAPIFVMQTVSSGAFSAVWGDYDNDGDLDLALGDVNPSRVYRNENGQLNSSSFWSSGIAEGSRAVAWGDYDGDGWLDLAVGNGCYSDADLYNCTYPPGPSLDRIYRNDSGVLSTTPIWSSPFSDNTKSIAWGDYDGDGDLDLFMGNVGQDRLYRNDGMASDGITPILTLAWSSPFTDDTRSIALGDYDHDGDLDLAAGNGGVHGVDFQPDRLYRNNCLTNDNSLPVDCTQNSDLVFTPVWTQTDNSLTTSIAWGDYDGDGWLDLAIGNIYTPTLLYRNIYSATSGQTPLAFEQAVGPPNQTQSIAWGDYDSDGDLDLAIGKYVNPSQLYRNDLAQPGGFSRTFSLVWQSPSNLVDQNTSLAWGDLDNDGDLDLAAGAANNGITRIYYNNSATLPSIPQWTTPQVVSNYTYAIAWGDYDGDGYQDLAVGNSCQRDLGEMTTAPCYPDQILRYDGLANDGITPVFNPVWTSTITDYTLSLAWGDVDGNGWLDLAIGNYLEPNRLYYNFNGVLESAPSWSSAVLTDPTTSLAWGDVDGDGWLDLAVGNGCVLNCDDSYNRLYRNISGALEITPTWSLPNPDYPTTDLAWGDYDGDGDLDLVIAAGVAKIYRNDGGILTTDPVWSSPFSAGATSAAWGDYDGDGDLDLAISTYFSPSRLYRNDGIQAGGGVPKFTDVWQSTEIDTTGKNTWLDYDNDGDLDLGVSAGVDRVYRNDNGLLTPNAIWRTSGTGGYMAWGDYNGDGDLDLAASIGYLPFAPPLSNIMIYGNSRDGQLTPSPIPIIRVTRPGPLATNANFYSTSKIWSDRVIPISYTLIHPRNQPVRQIIGQYSLNGGGQWLPAVPTTTQTTNLNTSPTGVTHVFNWDVQGSGVLGQSDNVVFRLIAIPAISNTVNAIPGPYLYGSYASSTFPFRVRGSQVRVISGTIGISNAIVYRLPNGQTNHGLPMGTSITTPFRTNIEGFLAGRGQIAIGDQLLALASVPLPPPYTERYSNTLRLYYTNGTPTPLGVDARISNTDSLSVIQPGVQQLAVSPDNPLLLFDLNVSLEWDASNNTAYLDRLAKELQDASEFLYDFTNGQAALGRITVYQNREAWDTADIQIRATNRLRPFASQGGLVLTDTVDPGHQTPPDRIIYQPGQVTMGATWNRYGRIGQDGDPDWPLALAHELSHYLLFLDDTYMGLNEADLLLPVVTCSGSAMGDVYLPDNTEFIYDEAFWQANCADTLAARTLGRNEWQTIRLWYPWTVQPTTSNAGPTLMPFDLTSVDIRPPAVSNNLLDGPTFELVYSGGAAAPASSRGQAFLLRGERIIDLGSPRGDLKTVLARGAQVGDTLCVFDPPQWQYGCETMAVGDAFLQLKQDNTWMPLIQLSPVNSTTFALRVETLLAGLSLNARLYPESGSPGSEINLTEVNGGYQAQLPVLSQPALAGHVRVWVSTDAATETNPRREAIVPFSIGGNPPKSRGGHAPVVSPDGQMIFFTRDEPNFGPGEFYLIQSMAGLPPLPPGKNAIGPGYNLLAAPGTPVITGSVSFQYLQVDVDTEKADETQLSIHFWNGMQWRALETVGNSNYNLASARSQGPGIYALLAGVTTPIITVYDPSVATNNLTTTLVITGSNFLAPLQVELRGSTVYTLTGQVVSSTTLTATIPPGLPAQEYQPVVFNGDGGSASVPGTLSLFNQDSACFYDTFESGANKWQRSDKWGIVTFGDGNGRAMTDTPTHPYLNAPPPALTHTTAITSLAFSLVNCPQPVLTFSHAYDIYNFSEPWGTSRDVGQVEISTFDDQAGSWSDWQELGRYFNGVNSLNLDQASVTSPEWLSTASLQPVKIDLNGYSGMIRLRFSLEVDDQVAGKGWLIDNLRVDTQGTLNRRTFLPIAVRE